MNRTLFAALAVVLVLRAAPPTYDLAHEVVLSGTVQRVVRHGEHGRAELHLLVATEERPLEIHLCPPHFLNWHQFHLYAGMKVEITAARAPGEAHYRARRVKLGERALFLRDEEGKPLWR